MSTQKTLGQVFTPLDIASKMLDEVKYSGDITLTSTLMEPSFGEGVFLLEAATRIIEAAQQQGIPNEEIRELLDRNLHGVEIDESLYAKTIASLDELIIQQGVGQLQWTNLVNQDALDFYHAERKYDFVVGNPPYVRIHRLPAETKQKLKEFQFTNGTTDLYVAFFELGLSLLKEGGHLIFITPNSYLRNTSQSKFRKFLYENTLVRKIINFRSTSVFNDASTYAAITHLSKEKSNGDFTYASWTDEKQEYIAHIDASTYWGTGVIDPANSWNFGDERYNTRLVDILSRPKKVGDSCLPLVGIMTNRNDIYICALPTDSGNDTTVVFNGYEVEKSILRPVVKGSRYSGEEVVSRILFPYIWNEETSRHIPMKEECLSKNYPLAYVYLKSHEEELRSRDMDSNATEWFQFGRSQGLPNPNLPRLAIKNTIRGNLEQLDVHLLPGDTLVYAGFFIIPKCVDGVSQEELLSSLKEVQAALSAKEFAWYGAAVGKDISGDYKYFNTKDISRYGLP